VDINGSLTDVTMMSGYSAPEINSFVLFARRKYHVVSNLNASWGSNFSSFLEISQQMRTFGWHEQPNDPNHSFQFPNGRKDWLDFRTRELKNFLDTLCLVTKKINRKFRFGLQFGSFYDNLLTLRGFCDPTPLLEKVDFFITDEIAEYKPNFDFAANYSRSLARYWNWKNRHGPKNEIQFATETNWPSYGFDEQHPKGYTPDALCRNWTIQLETFYQNGASAHFVSLWGTMEAILYHFADSIKSGFYMRPDQYLAWSETLSHYRYVRAPISPKRAVYFACQQTVQTGKEDDRFTYTFGEQVGVDTGSVDTATGYKILPFYEFPFTRFTKPPIDSTTDHTQTPEFYDIVTDYIIETSPEYLSTQYNELYLTPSSSRVWEKASRNLKGKALRKLKIKR
jgi:hypothetical protein